MEEEFNLNEHIEDKLRERLAKKYGVNKEQTQKLTEAFKQVLTEKEYSEAVEKYGAVKGSYMSMKRILRCNPFSKGGYDPVP